MSWNLSTKGEGSIPPLADDMYDAVCIKIIDMGTQHWEYEGKAKSGKKVFFVWAVEGETVDIEGEAKPRIVSSEYTQTLGAKAKLRAHLEGWRGKAFDTEGLEAFDIAKVLGQSCRILVGTTKTGKSNKVESVKKAKHQVTVPAGMDTLLFQLSDWDGVELPEGIPNFIKEKIQDTAEYREAKNGGVTAEPEAQEDPADDGNCPF